MTLDLNVALPMRFTTFFFDKHYVEQNLKIMIHCVSKLNHQMALHHFFVIIRRNFISYIRYIS